MKKNIILFAIMLVSGIGISVPAFASNNVLNVNYITKSGNQIFVNWTLNHKANIPLLANPPLTWGVYLVEANVVPTALDFTAPYNNIADGRLFRVNADSICAAPHLADLTDGTTETQTFDYIIDKTTGAPKPIASSTATLVRLVAYKNVDAFCNLLSGAGNGNSQLSGTFDTEVYNISQSADPNTGQVINITNPANAGYYVNEFGFVDTETGGISGDVRAVVYFSTSTLNITPFSSPNAYIAVFPNVVSSGTSTQITALSKSLWVGTSTRWYAYALLYNSDYSVFYSSSSISFQISDHVQIDPFAQYTAGLAAISCDSGGAFFSSSTLSSLACYLKQAGQDVLIFLFAPHNITLQFFSDSLSKFQNIFPFSVFFQFQDIVQEQVGSFSNSGATFVFPIRLPNGASSTIPLLTSSSIASVVGQNTMDTWFEFQKYLAWALSGWFMLRIMIKSKKK